MNDYHIVGFLVGGIVGFGLAKLLSPKEDDESKIASVKYVIDAVEEQWSIAFKSARSVAETIIDGKNRQIKALKQKNENLQMIIDNLKERNERV